MEQVHGKVHLINIGPSIIMPDGVLDWIVDCTHFFKIKTVDDLSHETHWSKACQYGMDIITIVHSTIPLSISSSIFIMTPFQPCQALQPVLPPGPNAMPTVSLSDDVVVTSTSLTTVSKKNKCSACGVEGHNSMVCSIQSNLWLMYF